MANPNLSKNVEPDHWGTGRDKRGKPYKGGKPDPNPKGYRTIGQVYDQVWFEVTGTHDKNHAATGWGGKKGSAATVDRDWQAFTRGWSWKDTKKVFGTETQFSNLRGEIAHQKSKAGAQIRKRTRAGWGYEDYATAGVPSFLGKARESAAKGKRDSRELNPKYEAWRQRTADFVTPNSDYDAIEKLHEGPPYDPTKEPSGGHGAFELDREKDPFARISTWGAGLFAGFAGAGVGAGEAMAQSAAAKHLRDLEKRKSGGAPYHLSTEGPMRDIASLGGMGGKINLGGPEGAPGTGLDEITEGTRSVIEKLGGVDPFMQAMHESEKDFQKKLGRGFGENLWADIDDLQIGVKELVQFAFNYKTTGEELARGRMVEGTQPGKEIEDWLGFWKSMSADFGKGREFGGAAISGILGGTYHQISTAVSGGNPFSQMHTRPITTLMSVVPIGRALKALGRLHKGSKLLSNPKVMKALAYAEAVEQRLGVGALSTGLVGDFVGTYAAFALGVGWPLLKKIVPGAAKDVAAAFLKDSKYFNWMPAKIDQMKMRFKRGLIQQATAENSDVAQVLMDLAQEPQELSAAIRAIAQPAVAEIMRGEAAMVKGKPPPAPKVARDAHPLEMPDKPVADKPVAEKVAPLQEPAELQGARKKQAELDEMVADAEGGLEWVTDIGDGTSINQAKRALQDAKNAASEHSVKLGDLSAAHEFTVRRRVEAGRIEEGSVRLERVKEVSRAPDRPGTGRVGGDKPYSSYDRRTNTVTVDEPRLKQKYLDRAWRKPKVKGVDPIPDGVIRSLDDFREFTRQHEFGHAHSRRSLGETKAQYENRMNKHAIDSLLRQRGERLDIFTDPTHGPMLDRIEAEPYVPGRSRGLLSEKKAPRVVRDSGDAVKLPSKRWVTAEEYQATKKDMWVDWKKAESRGDKNASALKKKLDDYNIRYADQIMYTARKAEAGVPRGPRAVNVVEPLALASSHADYKAWKSAVDGLLDDNDSLGYFSDEKFNAFNEIVAKLEADGVMPPSRVGAAPYRQWRAEAGEKSLPSARYDSSRSIVTSDAVELGIYQRMAEGKTVIVDVDPKIGEGGKMKLVKPVSKIELEKTRARPGRQEYGLAESPHLAAAVDSIASMLTKAHGKLVSKGNLKKRIGAVFGTVLMDDAVILLKGRPFRGKVIGALGDRLGLSSSKSHALFGELSDRLFHIAKDSHAEGAIQSMEFRVNVNALPSGLRKKFRHVDERGFGVVRLEELIMDVILDEKSKGNTKLVDRARARAFEITVEGLSSKSENAQYVIAAEKELRKWSKSGKRIESVDRLASIAIEKLDAGENLPQFIHADPAKVAAQIEKIADDLERRGKAHESAPAPDGKYTDVVVREPPSASAPKGSEAYYKWQEAADAVFAEKNLGSGFLSDETARHYKRVVDGIKGMDVELVEMKIPGGFADDWEGSVKRMRKHAKKVESYWENLNFDFGELIADAADIVGEDMAGWTRRPRGDVRLLESAADALESRGSKSDMAKAAELRIEIKKQSIGTGGRGTVWATKAANDVVGMQLRFMRTMNEARSRGLKIERQLKANVVTRNIRSHINNFTTNYMIQTLSRGSPLVMAQAVKSGKMWLDFNKGRIGPKHPMYGRLKALAETGFVDRSFLEGELGSLSTGRGTLDVLSDRVRSLPGGGYGAAGIMKWRKALDAADSGYKFGDTMYRVEEALFHFERLEQLRGAMELGSESIIPVKGGSHKLEKTAGGWHIDGKVASEADVSTLFAKYSIEPANAKFFDYNDLPVWIKRLKTSSALRMVASPFMIWLWKSLDVPGHKKGLGHAILSGPPEIKSTSKGVNAALAMEHASLAVRRATVIQALQANLDREREVAADVAQNVKGGEQLMLTDLATNPLYNQTRFFYSADLSEMTKTGWDISQSMLMWALGRPDVDPKNMWGKPSKAADTLLEKSDAELPMALAKRGMKALRGAQGIDEAAMRRKWAKGHERWDAKTTVPMNLVGAEPFRVDLDKVAKFALIEGGLLVNLIFPSDGLEVRAKKLSEIIQLSKKSSDRATIISSTGESVIRTIYEAMSDRPTDWQKFIVDQVIGAGWHEAIRMKEGVDYLKRIKTNLTKSALADIDRRIKDVRDAGIAAQSKQSDEQRKVAQKEGEKVLGRLTRERVRIKTLINERIRYHKDRLAPWMLERPLNEGELSDRKKRRELESKTLREAFESTTEAIELRKVNRSTYEEGGARTRASRGRFDKGQELRRKSYPGHEKEYLRGHPEAWKVNKETDKELLIKGEAAQRALIEHEKKGKRLKYVP